jgi:hypothetical protein
VIHAIVYTPTPPLAPLTGDLPPAIVAAVERAMEKNRDARFPDVNSFVKAVTSRSLATAPTVAAVANANEKITRQDPNAPTERIARPAEPSRAPVFIAFGVAVVASVAFTVWKLKPREPDEPAQIQQTSTPPPPPTPAPTRTASPPPPSNTNTDTPSPTRAEKSDEPKADTEPPKPSAKESPRAAKSGGTAKESPLSPEAARDLDEAEAALAAGKPGEAVRLAQHSLYTQKSSRAYAVMTRARCAQGDLGNAKASFAHVAPRDRSQVTRACGKLDIDLK